MRRSLTIAAMLSFGGVLLSVPMYAQCIPGLDPLAHVAGAWGFKVQGVGVSSAAVGRFTASIGTDPRAPGITQGILTTTETDNGPAGLMRLVASKGKFTVFPDCTGGTLMLGPTGLSNSYRSFDFVFVTSFGEMYLVSTDSSGSVMVGTAKRAPLPPPA